MSNKTAFYDNSSFEGPVEWTCFQTLIKDPVKTAGTWLEFLELDNRRLGNSNDPDQISITN